MINTMGISGAGWIADFYRKQLLELEDRFQLKGCSGNTTDKGRERLRAKCGEWDVKAYASFDEMLLDSQIDCVGIMSPTYLHFDQVSRALKAGKHVLVEKPVTLDLQEMKELAELAESSGKILFPGHNFVYRPVVRKAKEIIDRGDLGTVSYASFRSAHFIPEDHAAGWRKDMKLSGGGAMMDSGTHLVYQFLYLMGQPEWLSCFKASKNYSTMDGEDTCQISLQSEDGRVAQIFQSWSCQDDSCGEIRIQGTKGVLLITDKLTFNGEVIEKDSTYEKSFYHTLNAFADAIENNSPPLSDIKAAEKTLQIIKTAYKAADDRSTVSLRFEK